MKRNKLLLVALILGAAYVVYSLWYWFGGGAAGSVGADSASQVGAGLATMLVTPHLVLTMVAVVFNALAFFMGKPRLWRGFSTQSRWYSSLHTSSSCWFR